MNELLDEEEFNTYLRVVGGLLLLDIQMSSDPAEGASTLDAIVSNATK